MIFKVSLQADLANGSRLEVILGRAGLKEKAESLCRRRHKSSSVQSLKTVHQHGSGIRPCPSVQVQPSATAICLDGICRSNTKRDARSMLACDLSKWRRRPHPQSAAARSSPANAGRYSRPACQFLCISILIHVAKLSFPFWRNNPKTVARTCAII